MMTKREVFEKGKTHLLTQKRKSLSEDGNNTCLYRGPNGLMCGAGVFIPDEAYRPEIEGKLVETPTVWPSLGLPDDYKMLVIQLQFIHDNYSVEQWSNQLDNLKLALDNY